MSTESSRRSFLRNIGYGSLGVLAANEMFSSAFAQTPSPGEKVLGKSGVETTKRSKQVWKPVSDRKIRVGIVGNGVCKFGPSFGFQDHPNVTVAAVSDLFPDRCAEMSKVCRCEKTYPSLEELVKDDSLEAVFVATDAPSHPRHCIEVLKHGKHVASAVPASFGSMDEAFALYEAVKASGKKYMMFETSAFHDDCHAEREIYRAGGFGKLTYAEGEYYHFAATPIPSYKDWRVGGPPQYYPTHSNAYYCCVTGGSFTEVSCMGTPAWNKLVTPDNNRYKNPFGTEIALFRTSEGGMARMAVSWDTQGYQGEMGRVRGERGSMTGMKYQGKMKKFPDLEKPALPPTVATGHHGGSSGYLMNEFVLSILEDRKPLVDIVMALNLTVSGIVAHQSALQGGELLKIPQFTGCSGAEDAAPGRLRRHPGRWKKHSG
jgi:predicted dehydrogenase